MCHAPIVVPEVAGHRARQCSETTRAMADVAARVRAHAPDVLVLVSPHTARHATRWGICAQTPLQGNFGRHGAAHIGVTLNGAPDAALRLAPLARELRLTTRELVGDELDHGALVPLYFLNKAGFNAPILLLAPPEPGTRTEERMGLAIARAADQAGERWVVLASGDMSHRLTPGAPSGYHPLAKEFDRTFKARIDTGDLRGACAIDTGLRELAAEDVVDACTVASAAVGYRSHGHHTYSYEGPFGVGYLQALLFEESPPLEPGALAGPGKRPWPVMLQIARNAIAAKISHDAYRVPVLPKPWNTVQGVFVTLRDRHGAMRGCVGHVEPLFGTLSEEIASCAAGAATQDTRFPRVTPKELPALRIELSLLSKPEPVTDISALDPHRYGVVVSSGRARGVLLPGLEGVDTVEEQLRLAAAKGQLPTSRTWVIERFDVQTEADGPEALGITTMRGGHA
ncbi:MAG: AmmeMemoRadiSam system protein A [Polyangiales bacterium]